MLIATGTNRLDVQLLRARFTVGDIISMYSTIYTVMGINRFFARYHLAPGSYPYLTGFGSDYPWSAVDVAASYLSHIDIPLGSED